MEHHPELQQSALELIRLVNDSAARDDNLVILEVILACAHPDFVMSPASAASLPTGPRTAVAAFVQTVLRDGLSDTERAFLFRWAQERMLSGPGAPRVLAQAASCKDAPPDEPVAWLSVWALPEVSA
jgi:hypothetical protein